MLRARSKCTRILQTKFSHRIDKPFPSLIQNFRNFKSGPDLINDFGIRNEALPKRLIPRCNFNHWLAAELELFKRADDIPGLAILAWSAFCFYVISTLLSFIYLVSLIEKVENEDLTDDALAIYKSRFTDHQSSEFHDHRDNLELKCFSDILTAREDLAEAYRFYKVWFGSILSCTFGYYLVMGHKLGMNEITNLKLSIKRLCRRRGFAWSTMTIGYFCLNVSSLNYYYTSYILGPKYRALSLMPDDYSGIKRKFLSAYGGRGLALHRIFANEKINNEKVLALAQQVAFHTNMKSIDESGDIKISKSHVFKWGYGLQYRSPKACDGMPEHCWFNNTDEINKYVEALQIVSKRMQKNQPKKHKEKKEKPSEKSFENDEEEPRENVRLGIGMAYGGTEDWETRFIKASHNELAKASLERLEMLQLLAKIRRITKDYPEKPLYESFYEYSRSIRDRKSVV